MRHVLRMAALGAPIAICPEAAAARNRIRGKKQPLEEDADQERSGGILFPLWSKVAQPRKPSPGDAWCGKTIELLKAMEF
jgi:hypothetical protein